MRTSIVAMGLILAAAGLAGCVATGQPWAAQPAKSQAANGKAPVSTPAQIDAAIAAMDKITEGDRDSVAKDLVPKEDIQFDQEKRQLLVEVKSVLASGDKTRARDWKRRWDELEARKAEVDKRFLNAWFARHPGMAGQDTGSPFAGRTDPGCIGGRCESPPPGPSRTCIVNGNGWVGQVPC
ncbi:hypothetical protein GQ56_0111555 [Burkholderia paludis]|uniref:hypothetical protein n=1 Tax=Burkholderia paludis TaxID=1506587 RepID=UPI0004DB880D|nr:hypothetical protein [Burkholderia paludis]KFG97187.1 hypothetical protein GQ56_0111555 [Burkholderia paludis]